MEKNNIDVMGVRISIEKKEDYYLCITDMIKEKDGQFFIVNWLRNRNTLEYIGIWESLYNKNFNYVEFDIIKSKAGLNNFRISVKEFIGNMRDYASIEQLLVLANMESYNSMLIEQGVDSKDRIVKLNEMAKSQMKVLMNNNMKLIK